MKLNAFHLSTDYLNILFMQCLPKLSAQFFYCIVGNFKWIWELLLFFFLFFFVYSGCESFVENTYCNTLFQSVPFFFTLIMVYFDEKTFILKIYSDLLFFMVSCFCVYLMNLCLPNINDIVDFFLESFIILVGV